MIKQDLKTILDIQELDMKMLRLLRIRKERQKELKQIAALREELHLQVGDKEKEIAELSDQIQVLEHKIQEIVGKIKRLESQQGSIKKVEEFNAITQEMTVSERERIATEQKVSDLVDKKVAEEDLLTKIKDSMQASESSSLAVENDILRNIKLINEEGSSLKIERDNIAQNANPELFRIYETLFKNKYDRVVVPIENRTCSGCHIALTAQHENIVRKGENIVFCEHCSRIHYWPSEESSSGNAGTAILKRRRRKATVS